MRELFNKLTAAEIFWNMLVFVVLALILISLWRDMREATKVETDAYSKSAPVFHGPTGKPSIVGPSGPPPSAR